MPSLRLSQPSPEIAENTLDLVNLASLLITKRSHLDNLYKSYEIECAVEIDLASENETPETVREEYCGAYIKYFKDCGLSFPILELVIDI
ncbi:hypothetical protein Bca4012_009537 [Brassica carinata]